MGARGSLEGSSGPTSTNPTSFFARAAPPAPAASHDRRTLGAFSQASGRRVPARGHIAEPYALFPRFSPPRARGVAILPNPSSFFGYVSAAYARIGHIGEPFEHFNNG